MDQPSVEAIVAATLTAAYFQGRKASSPRAVIERYRQMLADLRADGDVEKDSAGNHG